MDLKAFQETPPWEWPKDAAKRFRAVLSDKRADEANRILAAELAGDCAVINDELVDALLAIMRSPDEPELLRARAAIALGPALEMSDMDGFEEPITAPISERAFRRIQESLQKLYLDESVPKELRRRILEAAVRAPEPWHRDAIRTAYQSGDSDWMVTAVFAMRYVRGFDDQILESLKSADEDIHYEAVIAAGNWSLDAAWPHVSALVSDEATPKRLLLAAIGAVGGIRPEEGKILLLDFAESDDEEIADAADEALMWADPALAEEDDEEDDGSDWIN